MMKAIGYLSLVIGFLAATFVASLDPQQINWSWFIPTIVVGLVGVALIRKSRHGSARAEHVLSGNRQVLERSLDNVVKNLAALKARKTDIPTYEMRFEIDRIFRDDLRDFVDARESMIHLFGLRAYADVMSAFAAGERYINRIWSASTDGYQDEVLAYVDKADEQFMLAQQKLRDVIAELN